MKLVRTFVALAVATAILSGCYVVPVQRSDGAIVYQHYPLPPAGATMPMSPGGTMAAPQGGAMPAILNARLYPANEIATRTGIVVGTVTNMMTGKGRFQVNYMDEVLTGEATRVSNEERRGVASAYSPKGTYMSCDYQMNTPYQGTGNCTFSNGAMYQIHLGNN